MSFKPTHPLSGPRSLRGCCLSPRQFPKWQEAWRSYTALRRCRPNRQPWSPDLLRPAAQPWAGPVPGVSRLCRGEMRSRECLGSVSLDLEVLVTSARARRCGALATQVTARQRERCARGRGWRLGEPLGCSWPPWPIQQQVWEMLH